VRLLGTGRPRTDKRAFTCNQIGVAETRQANVKEMELSPAAQVEGLDPTLSDTYATPSQCMAVVVGISAFTFLPELAWREPFEGGRCRVLSGSEQGCGCNGHKQGWLEGCSAPTWSIIRLIT
jgi:hypothetical protein